jgi:hypothetical protein
VKAAEGFAEGFDLLLGDFFFLLGFGELFGDALEIAEDAFKGMANAVDVVFDFAQGRGTGASVDWRRGGFFRLLRSGRLARFSSAVASASSNVASAAGVSAAATAIIAITRLALGRLTGLLALRGRGAFIGMFGVGNILGMSVGLVFFVCRMVALRRRFFPGRLMLLLVLLFFGSCIFHAGTVPISILRVNK